MMFEVFDKRFEDLVDTHAKLEVLGEDFQFTEGPLWHADRRCLYFSDIPADTIFCYKPEKGISTFRHPSGFSNGLTLDADGNLIVCEHKTRAVTIQTTSSFEVLASTYRGRRLNSPNDLIISREGAVIFTDPIYGLREGMGGPAKQELDFQGVFLVKPGMPEPHLLLDDFERPNGLAFSLDQKTLYIIDTVRQHIRAFAVGQDWHLSNQGVFAELFGEGQGRPDGMKLDQQGNIFCTGPGGIWVFSPDADLLGKIRLDQKTANLAWGDTDRRSLYITSSNFLYRLRCKTAGLSPMDSQH